MIAISFPARQAGTAPGVAGIEGAAAGQTRVQRRSARRSETSGYTTVVFRSRQLPRGRLRIVIVSPDRHLIYDGSTPDRTGVGGGVTVRIRVAAALARRGHSVSLIVNCPRRASFHGVRYLPLDQAERVEADVLVLHTTGGALDLRPALARILSARLRIVFVDGVDEPGGMSEAAPDLLYAPSNFIARTAIRDWRFPRAKIFVTPHGVEPSFFRPALFGSKPGNDPRRLLYTSHPSKGMQAAVGLLRLLRSEDPGFELHVYGGNRLWAEQEANPRASEPGVVYHGLTGQARLARELKRGGFAMHLQTRPEPFGISLVEAMAAGVLPLASPVGAYPELVRHGFNGLLVDGDPNDPGTHQRAAEWIRCLLRRPGFAAYLRRNARAAPLNWDQVAEAWEEHWAYCLDGARVESRPPGQGCPECGGPWLPLADGYHCTGCGMYSRDGLVQ